jgi:TonB-dependent starch-binding outer membrane protein SusC
MKKKLKKISLLNEGLKKTFLVMKLLLLLSVAFASQINASVYSQNTLLSVQVKNTSIRNTLNQLEQSSKFKFFFNEDFIDVDMPVSLNVSNANIDDILRKMLDKTNIDYRILENNIVVLAKKETLQKQVTGTVKDANTGELLTGVSISLEGTAIGTITDVDGKFSIEASGENAVLVFSYIGYLSERIPVSGQAVLDVRLSPDIKKLNEVMVVGYGTQVRHNVTGAISSLKTDEVADMPVPNIGTKMQGKFAGVQINQNSGTPGAEMSFRIRGAASVNGTNSPLIVIDGFPSSSGLQTLSPDEIESISVLKDASASSLYGSRAANGVILVTTKQAKEGQKSLQFSAYTGVQSVPDRGKPDLMNAVEFAQFKKEYYEDAAKYEGYTGGVPAVYQNPEEYANKPGTDWFNILLRKALTQNYNLTYSSGTKELKSLFNVNYNKQEGVIINSYDERFTARSNNIYAPSDRITVGANLEFSYGNNFVVPGLDNGRNYIELAYLMDPSLNYKNPDGTYPISFSQPGMFANPNYYVVLTKSVNKTKAARIIANGYAEVRIIDNLKFKSSINVNINNTINRSFYPSDTQGWLGSAPPQPATGSYATSNYLTWLSENTLTYQKSLGKHNIDLMAGYTFQKYSSENSNIDGSQFPDDNVQWINAATTRIGNVGAVQWTLLSYIGRLNYNYDNKYLLSFAFRRDGSSRFGPNNKFGNFPSVSLGWVVSDEEFMKNITPVSFLKIRGSYGKVGNNDIGDYRYISSLNTSNYVFGNQVASGKVLSGIGNNNLTWETTKSYDLGLDLELFNNRISFTYDYYWKKTDGLLYNIKIPEQSGYSTVWSNIGRLDFWGHEFSIETKNLTGKFKWNTTFNISFDRNLVKQLGVNNTPIGGDQEYWDDNRTAVGHPIGLFYGYINTGVYMTQQEFETQPHDATAMVGTARFKDVSGPDSIPDGKIDSYDRTFIGNPNPDFIYGMTNSFSYKNFDLSISIAGTVGNDIADDAFQSTENLDGVFNVRKGVAHRWRSEQDPGDGIYPRTRSGTTEDFRNFTSRQVFKGTYLEVKNITLGYTLPVKKSMYFKSLRVYVSSQNTFIFTKYPGMNPEAGMSGLNGLNQGRDFTGYPVPKIFSGGINVSF